MPALSAIVTTLDNARTLEACLASIVFADEVLVLDSGSTDDTLAIARRFNARIEHQAFLGYGRQKQRAAELATHDWILLLDADEALSVEAQGEIRALMAGAGDASTAALDKARVAGYTLPRREQRFWRMSHPKVRHNRFLRLYDRRCGRVSDDPVHAAPKVEGDVGRLRGELYHYGETSVRVKLAKVSSYAAGLVSAKRARHRRARPWMMLVYPPLVFIRSYFFKRLFLDGWAGFIAAVVMAQYAFLKHALWFEAERHESDAGKGMPSGAPPPPPPPVGPT